MKILNIENIRVGSIETICNYCNKKLSEKKGAFLIPLNPIKVIKSRTNKAFQSIIDSADLVFPDAWGISWAASFLYGKKIPITPGYKVMFSLLKQANNYHNRVYFLGTTDYILNIALSEIKMRYPNLDIVGWHNGFFKTYQEMNIFKEIAAAKPNYVFVAMGELKQEIIIQKCRSIYKNAIYMGVGGTIDLVAGEQPDPPEWIRTKHLEWLFRLIRQPFRAPRFKALPIFVYLVLQEKLRLSRCN